MKDQTKTKKQLIEELEALRKQAAELKKEHSFCSSVITNAGEGICVCHNIPEYPYVKFTVWNSHMTEITGYTMQEINKYGWYQTVYPDPEIQARAVERMERMRHGDDLHAEPWEITRKDGKKRVLSITTSIIESKEGSIHVMAIMDDITERKRAAEAILQVRRDWENIFQAIGHPTIILDAQHNILSVNRATVKAAGAGSAEELIGRKCYEIFHNASEPPDGCPLVKMLSSTKIETNEMEVEALGGVFLVSCTPVFDEKGNIQKIIHIATDITERKRAEEALIESEERFRQVAESAEEWIWEVDVNGLYTYASPVVEKILGYRSEEIVGKKNFYDFFTPEMREGLKKAAFEAFKSKKVFSKFVNPNVHKNGYIVILETSGTPILDKMGNLLGYRGADMDITEHKRAEEEIQRQLSIINTYTGMIALTDMEGLVLYMNAGGARMAGYKHPSEVIGIKHIPDFQSPEDLQHLMGVCIPTAFEKGVWTGEGRLLRKDGSSIPVDQTVFVIRDENGQPRNLGAIVTDITERKRAEEALRKSEALLNSTQQLTKVGGWEWDAEKQTMFWTDESYRIHGFRPDEIALDSPQHIDRSLECYDPKDRPVILAAFQHCAQQGEGYDLEFPFTTAEGRRIWIRTTAIPVLKDGRIIKVIGNIMDITERKQSEELLRMSEERFRILFENAPLGIGVSTLEGKVLAYNEVISKITGYTKEELLNFNVRNLYQNPEDRDSLLKQIKSNGYARNYEAILKRKNGTSFYANLTINMITFGDEKALLTVIEDITERKKAEEEIKKRVKELEEFYDIAVGRELRMKDLKEQMEEMKEKMQELKKELEKYKMP